MPESMSVCAVRGGRARIIVAKSGSMAPSTNAGAVLRRTASTVSPKKSTPSTALGQPGARLPDLAGRRATAEVTRQGLAVLDQPLDCGDHGPRRVRVIDVLEHHRAGPDLRDRIGHALAGDVGRGALARLPPRRDP